MPDFDVEALMLDWPALTTESIVFDVGAFEGRWAAKIADKYNPALYLFEPQTDGAHINRLHAGLAVVGANYRLFPYALGERDAELPMGEFDTDGCSFLLTEEDARKPGNTRTQMGRGLMVDAARWLDLYGLENVDLAVINIEGYEFRLLPYLIETGDILRFERLAVQFHLFVPDAYEQYARLRDRLGETHLMLWDGFPTWVAWERRAS